jgi:branched-chain amino acid transport system substrate-binding protein
LSKLGAYLLGHHTGQTGAGSVSERISSGNKLLIAADATAAKQAGINAFAKENYATATREFQSALNQRRNDPETLIYLNNARLGSDRTFKIAVSVPIGSNLNVAQEMLRGVAQAQDEVNQAGGINGTGLRVTIINDENDPAIAKQVAAELVNDPQVLAVVGHNTSEASLAAAPIYQNGQLVMITPTSSANQLSGFGSYIFRTLPATRFVAEPLAQYAIKTVQKSRIAVCYDSQAPDNLTFRDEFTASLIVAGGKLITIDCDLASPGFNPKVAIAQAISQGAEAVLLTPHIDRLERAVSLARGNQGKLMLLSSPSLYTFQTLQSGQSDMNGLTLPVVWHPQMPVAAAFTARSAQRWGAKVNWRTATAYDATRTIIEGLKQGITRSDLQSVLRSPAFSAAGAGEPVKFLPSGDRLSHSILVQVQPSNKGYDFVLIKP